MAIGDIYLLKDFYRQVDGVNMLNTYYYLGTGDGVAADLGQAFLDVVLPLVIETQPTDIKHYKVEVGSLFDPTDFASTNPNTDGVWPVGELTPFAALNYTLFIPTRAIKKGSRRVGTVPEDAATDGVVDDAGYVAAVEDVRNIFQAPIWPVSAGSKVFDPVVVKRIKEEIVADPPYNPPRFSYRLPTSFGEADYANVTTCTVNLNVTSQVSRKL